MPEPGITLYAQLGAAAKTAYDRSQSSTTVYKGTEESDSVNVYNVLTDKRQNEANSIEEESAEIFNNFDATRQANATSHLEEILETVIGEVTADVVDLITSDENLDAQLTAKRAAIVQAWTDIATDEGSIEDFVLDAASGSAA